MLKEPENFDIIPLSLLGSLCFKPPPQNIELLRQVPLGKGFAEIKRVRFSLADRKVMHRIIMRVLRLPVPLVDGDDLIADHQADRVDATDHQNLLVRMFSRNGVIVVVEANQCKRVGVTGFRSSGIEFRCGNREKQCLLFGKSFADCLLLPIGPLGELFEAFLFEDGVEFFKGIKLRNRDEEIATRILDGILDMPFLLGTPDATKMIIEQKMRRNPQELTGRLLAATADDLPHGNPGVVELDQLRDASKEMERPLEPLLERLRAFLREHLDITDITVR